MSGSATLAYQSQGGFTPSLMDYGAAHNGNTVTTPPFETATPSAHTWTLTFENTGDVDLNAVAIDFTYPTGFASLANTIAVSGGLNFTLGNQSGTSQSLTIDDPVTVGSNFTVAIDVFAGSGSALGAQVLVANWSNGILPLGALSTTTSVTAPGLVTTITPLNGAERLAVGDTGVFRTTVANSRPGSSYTVTLDPAQVTGSGNDLSFIEWTSLPSNAVLDQATQIVTIDFIAGSNSVICEWSASVVDCGDLTGEIAINDLFRRDQSQDPIIASVIPRLLIEEPFLQLQPAPADVIIPFSTWAPASFTIENVKEGLAHQVAINTNFDTLGAHEVRRSPGRTQMAGPTPMVLSIPGTIAGNSSSTCEFDIRIVPAEQCTGPTSTRLAFQSHL